MEHLFIKTEDTIRSCAFTGHRHLEDDFSEKKLKKEIKHLIKEGVTTFYTGMAMGFDMLAAELVLSFKKKYDIKLVCCIPCDNQDLYFSNSDKIRYAQILQSADEKVQTSTHYTKDCMHKRNRYMCDHADVLIAYCNRDTGGTAYTVSYFKKQKPFNPIILL